jgi:hypothetical protein
MRVLKRAVLSAAVASMLAGVPVAQASVQFGSNLTGGQGAVFPVAGGAVVWNESLPAANTAGSVTAPTNGIITSITIKSADVSGFSWSPVRLQVLKRLPTGLWTELGFSSYYQPRNDPVEQTFTAFVPIGAGQFIGLETPNAGNIPAALTVHNAISDTNTSPFSGNGTPGVPIGDTAVALRATLEPDRDCDGLGDETQQPPGPRQPGDCACPTSKLTSAGGPGDDLLVGTPRRDVIAGFGGNDTIKGLGGNDVLCGLDGNDTVVGGSGSDVLVGGPGRDKLRGGPGNDRCIAQRLDVTSGCER